MAGIWVIGEPGPDGALVRLSTEVATLARGLGASSGRDVLGVVVASPRRGGRRARSLSPAGPRDRRACGERPGLVGLAARRAAALLDDGDAEPPDAILVGSGPDGRDLAGALSALTGLGVLTNATAVSWSDTGPAVEMSAFGGKLLTTSGFTAGRGIVTVRPNVVTALPAAAVGTVEAAAPEGPSLPAVKVVERINESGAAASIEEARVIVAGGRGVGGPEGFGLVEQLAATLGGAVGATRAAVDSGWIGYSQQIGQTGKIVKPELYLALGISGAIQHKVGMQTAGSIVAVNRDPDAPIAEFADLLVVGDLFEVGNALLEQLRGRAG